MSHRICPIEFPIKCSMECCVQQGVNEVFEEALRAALKPAPSKSAGLCCIDALAATSGQINDVGRSAEPPIDVSDTRNEKCRTCGWMGCTMHKRSMFAEYVFDKTLELNLNDSFSKLAVRTI